jgi:DNA helicase HerA-like ATPase
MDVSQVSRLKSQYNAVGSGLKDIVVVVPPSKLDERRSEFPHLDVVPLQFSSSELSAAHWKFLMGAVGNPSLYLRQIGLIIRQLGSSISLDRIRQHIEQSAQLRDSDRELAMLRLQLAAPYIADETRIGELIRPGRLVIIDLRDESTEPRDALELFAVMLQIFSDVTIDGHAFSKLIVFDEAHKYMNNPSLTGSIIELVREMRHKATSILIASQEPRSVPVSLIELSTEIILHRFSSPEWLKHVQRANVALGTLRPTDLGGLKAGEAYIWSSKATEEIFTSRSIKIDLRPRVTKHGGDTKTAL